MLDFFRLPQQQGLEHIKKLMGKVRANCEKLNFKAHITQQEECTTLTNEKAMEACYEV